MERLYAGRKSDELLAVDRDDEPLWRVFRALVYKEAGDDARARLECKRLSESVKGNGDLCEMSLDAYVLTGDMVGLKREGENCMDYVFLWEWERKTLDFHLGIIDEHQLLNDANPFHNSMCVANYTIGLRYLSEGKRELAAKHFQIVCNTGRYGWHDFHFCDDAVECQASKVSNRSASHVLRVGSGTEHWFRVVVPNADGPKVSYRGE